MMSLRVVGVPNGRGGPELPGLGPGRWGPGTGPGRLAESSVLPQSPHPWVVSCPGVPALLELNWGVPQYLLLGGES